MPIIMPKGEIIVAANDRDYSLPLAVLQDYLDSDDEAIVHALAKYPPRTFVKREGIVRLNWVPPHLWKQYETVPIHWKIRYVVSEWAWNLMRVLEQAKTLKRPIDLDKAIQFIESDTTFTEYDYRNPLIYAHAYPHGNFQDVISYLPDEALQRLIFSETAMPWQQITEESNAPYLGYETADNQAPVRFDLAPLRYKDGKGRNKPFNAEEALVDTMCFFSEERDLFVPLKRGEDVGDRLRLDPEHDILAKTAGDP